ncbi:hypothetical protein JM83_1224 [Gillisia sp. Hel_I_86]|uniref:hypothetical protein n=1 Tax=Gillisia sp. Hel_I_86 TaxID=1249981 RepID=UPI0011994D68|nr:hypothetical protein [Gillisia sp. Hel_I_86]TVZ26270.1 hypothetical protein JM83_1224 [Gillisia sp. Hel_I_86]
MKHLYLFFSISLVTILFASCAGNNGLQEKEPATMDSAYYTTKGEEITFYIPVTAIQSNRVSLDEVYFRNKKANLTTSPDKPGVYMATFQMAKPDMIMSSDPKEEYGNKLPQKTEKMDFELKDDEAILIFTQNSKVKYYKLTGVKERV